MLDFHNHLIPQVDDGAQSIEASADGIATMREQGIRNIITTPHLRASMLAAEPDRADYFELVQSQWKILSAYARDHFPDVRLERGFEILLDLPEPDLTDPLTRLAGTQFVLVEFPFASVPPNSAQALFDMRMRGYEPIVAHPERYTDVQKELNLVEEWIRVGAHIQVNAGSVLGRYGSDATRTVSLILARGWASYISSDYHATGSCDSAEAQQALLARGASESTEMLFTTNPERILAGNLPLPVPPIQAKPPGLVDRLRSAFRRP